uniref:Ig-like domain-containing protein n=1 Tax=Electrophorus electricus TaxID=8005 RepID=A0AAY5EYJ5_ELEEL
VLDVHLFIFILTSTLFLDFAQAVDLYQKPSFISAKLGETVTFHCTFAKKHSAESMVWYKQTGVQILNIAVQSPLMEAIISSEYNKSHLKLERTKTNISFSILHAAKDDGGLYFCVFYACLRDLTESLLFQKGNPELTISVVQSPVLGRVSPGESVSLQCTVLSERRTAELQVLWFRAAAGDSHPEIIYTHHNSSHQCEISSSPHSCVYDLSKSVLSLSDTGTYYCAVTTCGKILLGNGTTYYYLNTAYTAVHDITSPKSRNQNHSCNAAEVLYYLLILSPQDHDAVELNYSALHFIDGKTRRRREKRGQTERSVYSEVLYSAATD